MKLHINQRIHSDIKQFNTIKQINTEIIQDEILASLLEMRPGWNSNPVPSYLVFSYQRLTTRAILYKSGRHNSLSDPIQCFSIN